MRDDTKRLLIHGSYYVCVALRSVMDVMVVLFSNLVPWVLDAISKNALIATAN